MSVVKEEEMVLNTALPGDALVLTKPLGTQLACNVKEWLVNEKRYPDENYNTGTTDENGDLLER